MSFNSVLAQFLMILNRDDCSSALATTFLTQALTQIEREARLPCMERTLIVTAAPTQSMNFITVPRDMLQPIDLMVQSQSGRAYVTPAFNSSDTWFPLDRKSYRQLLSYNMMDNPKVYARQNAQFWISGAIPPGVSVQFLYYGQFTPITDPTTDNEATASIPDLLIYKALGMYAAPYFSHDQGPQWEAIYQALLQSAQMLAEDADNAGGPAQISPIAGGDDGMGNWY